MKLTDGGTVVLISGCVVSGIIHLIVLKNNDEVKISNAIGLLI